MEVIPFFKMGETPAPADGYVVVSRSVANDGTLLFLCAAPEDEPAVTATYTRAGGAIFPRTRMDKAGRFRLIAMNHGSEWSVDLPPLDLTFPQIDLFPDGRVLLVGSRAAWRSAVDFDRNGVIVDPATGQMSRLLLGDGIEHALVDAIGRIWVGYFDEGVMGNFGWGGPGPEPVGAAGLVCFSDAGEKLWGYPAHGDNTIIDCYALNVADDGAALCFYTDFPVCTVSRDFRLRWWTTSLRGCNAFGIAGTRVLFSGQYKDPPDAGYAGTLRQDGSCDTQAVRFVLPDGVAFGKGQWLGRGSDLYYFAAEAVYRASIA